MKKFYMCEMRNSETLLSYTTRLEQLFEKAVELEGLRDSDKDTLLKQVLHAGLKRDLKQMSVYQCDKTASYDDFKRELRRLESEQPAAAASASEAKPCKPAVAEKKDTDPELKTLLQKLNDRIDALESRKSESTHEERPHYGYRRGFRG